MTGTVSAKVSKWEQTRYEWRQTHPLERRKSVRHLVTSEEKDQFGGNGSCEPREAILPLRWIHRNFQLSSLWKWPG